MTIQGCIHSVKNIRDISNLTTDTFEDIELLQSIAKLLYKTKSVRKTIEIIDHLSKQDDILFGFPIQQKETFYDYCLSICVESNKLNFVDGSPMLIGNYKSEINLVSNKLEELISKDKHESEPYTGC